MMGSKVYSSKNMVGMFLMFLKEEMPIKESLATPKPLVMTADDWENTKMQLNAIFVMKV